MVVLGRLPEINAEGKTKIFCARCKHLRSLDSFGYSQRYGCGHPNNHGNTWLGEGGELQQEPSKINKDNNCAWFEQKPTIIEKKSWWKRLFCPIGINK